MSLLVRRKILLWKHLSCLLNVRIDHTRHYSLVDRGANIRLAISCAHIYHASQCRRVVILGIDEHKTSSTLLIETGISALALKKAGWSIQLLKSIISRALWTKNKWNQVVSNASQLEITTKFPLAMRMAHLEFLCILTLAKKGTLYSTKCSLTMWNGTLLVTMT